MVLPRIFEDKSTDKKYEKWNGMPKISYSQITSWNDPQYKSDYIRTYMVGIPNKGNMFTDYGSACGTFIESIGTNNTACHDAYKHFLSDTDRETLLHKIEYPENSKYEDYIAINVDDLFVIEGYIDRAIYLPENKIIVQDFKTGSVAKKADYYSDPNYKQTNIYAYAKENEGYEVVDCMVLMFDRVGNGSAKSPIRLTGKVEVIPTPYNRKETEKFLKGVKKTAKEISDYYQKYKHFFE